MRETSGESWWWIAASSAQLVTGVAAYRRGSGDGTIAAAAAMPFKAFAIATLFIGAGATAAAGCLHASGIRTGDDMKMVGSRIRRWMSRLASNRD